MDDETGKEEKNLGVEFSRFAFYSASSVKSPSSSVQPLQLTSAASPKKRKSGGSHSESLNKKVASLQTSRLSDYLKPNLDVVFVGINPGVNSASHGHHYAGPGNHFWKCLNLSGLVPEPLTFYDDVRITDFGIGLTNVVERPSASSSDLSKAELQQGAIELKKKLIQCSPRIVVFNGLGIYEAFSGKKNFGLGRQPDSLRGTDGKAILLYVMPSSSPRGSKWPTAKEKLPFYSGLVHLREFVQGKVSVLDLEKVTFAK